MPRIRPPMARPAIAAVALFRFFFCGNDYFGPPIHAARNPGVEGVTPTGVKG
ncbi:hypothetical protein GCM10018779_42750 [Streptomyces griseocarneus]|nr:hypothetical protein GCM10018779_42750 [Streptomyces griseocarneus]